MMAPVTLFGAQSKNSRICVKPPWIVSTMLEVPLQPLVVSAALDIARP